MVINRREKHLMNAIYHFASQQTGQCLITPLEILSKIPYKVKFAESDLAPMIEALAIDGYFEYELATKKGEPVYFISLKEKGSGYEREKKQSKIKLIRRIITTIAFALLSWAVKVIVDAILANAKG
ncbi:MAG: hypothetical protein LBU04_05710 [Christensenellaceae bacterium]|jgi:hypothetical protein|nr:hypothetical protein [Christensenellaceae bacterium]